MYIILYVYNNQPSCQSTRRSKSISKLMSVCMHVWKRCLSVLRTCVTSRCVCVFDDISVAMCDVSRYGSHCPTYAPMTYLLSIQRGCTIPMVRSRQIRLWHHRTMSAWFGIVASLQLLHHARDRQTYMRVDAYAITARLFVWTARLRSKALDAVLMDALGTVHGRCLPFNITFNSPRWELLILNFWLNPLGTSIGSVSYRTRALEIWASGIRASHWQAGSRMHQALSIARNLQTHDCASTANLRTKILDFGGFDSSIILTLKVGIFMSIVEFPNCLSQQILVWIILVGRLGLLVRTGLKRYSLSVDTAAQLPDASTSVRAMLVRAWASVCKALTPTIIITRVSAWSNAACELTCDRTIAI